MQTPFIKNIFIFSSCLALVISSCAKEKTGNKATLEKLYELYKNGQISKCKLNNQTVYSTAHNVYDAGGQIYDKDGNLIARCNYAWGNVDEACKQVTNCEIVYMVKGNIWQQPAVDKYKLAK